MKPAFFLFLVIIFSLFSCRDTRNAYLCPPCNLECDDLTFSSPGTCPHCGMGLIKEEELTLNKVDIQTGSGYFQIEGNKGDTSKPVTVFYYKPQHFTPDSRVLLVIPGTGRSAGSYRDSWITAAEKNGWLILSPMYPERMYTFDDYHLCGLVDESNILDQVTYVDDTNYAQLDEEGPHFSINPHPSDWLFSDFDRIFDLAVKAVNAQQQHYTIFGHSAGGQILHKMALFSPQSKADKIIASNASFYTLPDSNIAFPFGLKNAPRGQVSLQQAFEKKNSLSFWANSIMPKKPAGPFSALQPLTSKDYTGYPEELFSLIEQKKWRKS